MARTLGNVSLFFWPLGPNAISVSLSPMGRYVMVGLASRRILLHPSTEHMVAQVFRLQQAHGGETSMRVSSIACASTIRQLSQAWQGNEGQRYDLPARIRDAVFIISKETAVQPIRDQQTSLLEALYC